MPSQLINLRAHAKLCRERVGLAMQAAEHYLLLKGCPRLRVSLASKAVTTSHHECTQQRSSLHHYKTAIKKARLPLSSSDGLSPEVQSELHLHVHRRARLCWGGCRMLVHRRTL